MKSLAYKYCVAPGAVSGRPRLNFRARGFTLIELMIGLVLLAVLLGISLPLYREFILDQRLRAISTDLRIALTTARSEAVKRNQAVSLEADEDGWAAGWSIATPNDPNEFILKYTPSGENVTITVTPDADVEFSASGRVQPSSSFSISVGPADDSAEACLTLGVDGRTSSVKEGCS